MAGNISCACSRSEFGTIEKVKITEEETLLLERSYFEYQGFLILISQFASDGPFVPNEERFEKILHLYMNAFMEYNIIFDRICNKYLTEEQLKKTYRINFEGNEIIVD